MKSLLISAVSLLSLMLLVAADPNDSGCYAADAPLCSPEASACAYRTYAADGAFTEDADADGDGWQDGCDAFPSDPAEWADLDGDEAGHNADCDDLDPGLRECGPLGGDEATVSPETADDIRGSASPIFDKNTRMLRPVPCHPRWSCGQWSACVDGVMTRACRDTWGCQTDEGKPETSMACQTQEVGASEPSAQSTTSVVPPVSAPPQPASVLSDPPATAESWWLLIGASLVLILMGVYRGRQSR